jgi:hypothetical protein
MESKFTRWTINRFHIIAVFLTLSVLFGCRVGAVDPSVAQTESPSFTPDATVIPTQGRSDDPGTEDLSADEAATLLSLQQVDDFPLYTMYYYGDYGHTVSTSGRADSSPSWGCSLFAAFGDGSNMLFGRNFDWEYSPAVLLFTDPPDGYASVSMVDIAFLGFVGEEAIGLTELPLVELEALLNSPFLPFDGMNEKGLAVGMAAVPPGGMDLDPEKETISSLMVIREMLDHAAEVDEAVDIIQGYNIDMSGGPPIHYLIADTSGKASLVEFFQGELVVTPNESPWHLATNFLFAATDDSPEGKCWRYDWMDQYLMQARGQVTFQGAVDLLSEVAQGNTQWSMVYGMSTGEIMVTMGRQYEDVHTFQLNLESE